MIFFRFFDQPQGLVAGRVRQGPPLFVEVVAQPSRNIDLGSNAVVDLVTKHSSGVDFRVGQHL